jgi:hypothetical protein
MKPILTLLTPLLLAPLAASHAADDSKPAEGDTQPTLNSTFATPATIHSVRLIW